MKDWWFLHIFMRVMKPTVMYISGIVIFINLSNYNHHAFKAGFQNSIRSRFLSNRGSQLVGHVMNVQEN